MNQPLKILSIIDIPWNSGLAYYAFEQARALRGGGHTVIFACPEGSAAAAFAARENFETQFIPGRKEYLRFPAAVRALRRLVRERGISVVCAHTGLAQTLAWLLRRDKPELRLFRVKADVKKPSLGFTINSMERVISASEYIEDLYIAAGLDPARSSMIRQGIDVQPYEYPPAVPPFRIGLLGRLDPVKGHECFLKAGAELIHRGWQAEFHIAGGEANLKYAGLEKIAGDLGIKDRVTFHGKVEDAAAFMKSCNIGVIASLGSEAVSRAALEWLACGRPLVATTAGSLPEFTAKNMLVPPGDPAALADKLSSLMSDPGQLLITGGVNRSLAADEFSRQAFAEATLWLISRAGAEGATK